MQTTQTVRLTAYALSSMSPNLPCAMRCRASAFSLRRSSCLLHSAWACLASSSLRLSTFFKSAKRYFSSSFYFHVSPYLSPYFSCFLLFLFSCFTVFVIHVSPSSILVCDFCSVLNIIKISLFCIMFCDVSFMYYLLCSGLVWRCLVKKKSLRNCLHWFFLKKKLL